MKILKNNKFILLKVIGIGISIILLGIPSYALFWNLKNNQTEKHIDQAFHQEVAQVPQIKVKSFRLWEGDSMVQADIENKGEVKFWYGQNGVPRIDSISSYTTLYDCFFVNIKGQKTDYAFTTGLVLDKESKYKKWFPFEVNTLKDLVDKYDSIIRILHTFPKKPEMIPFGDSWGKRQVVKQSDPTYILTQQLRGKEVVCDLFQ